MSVSKVDELLDAPPYGLGEAERQSTLLDLLRRQVLDATRNCPEYNNYVRHWPVPATESKSIAELPYLPVSVFKREQPLATVPSSQFQRVLSSSATTGQQPSRIAVDSITARRMSKGLSAIVSDFIGPERRPMLVVDDADTNKAGLSLGARGAAIRGLIPFASQTVFCLRPDRAGELVLDRDLLDAFHAENHSRPVILYGFTTILWTRFIKLLHQSGMRLSFSHAHVMHSGGWKKLTSESVDKPLFNQTVSEVIGCAQDRIIDFYGMVENLGVIYPDCTEGNKHAPSFGEVIVRDPLTMTPVGEGDRGIVQVCSVLPTSFPGHLLLTEDLATVIHRSGCSCGRPGIAFRFAERIPQAELRGCGDIAARRMNLFGDDR